MKKSPLVSIVTINFKQAEITNQLLKSLESISYPNIEIIVVDNHSGEKDIAKINASSGHINLICNLENLGFSGGNNVGIRASRGELILLLNNDTEVEPGFLEPMVEMLMENQNIGAVSPKIKYFDNPDIIQYAGFSRMHPLTLRMHAIGSNQKDNGLYNEAKETPFAHGCAMLVKREVIDKVGAMPEEYFLYYEEHDWSTTIRRNGYKIFFQPKSIVFHKESMSVQKNSVLKTYYLNRNRILFMRRNSSSSEKIMASLYILLISVPKNFLAYLFKGEHEHMKAYLNALTWNISNSNK